MVHPDLYCHYSDLPSPLAYAWEGDLPKKVQQTFTEKDRDRIIEMAWEDRTPFEAIAYQFGLNEQAVIAFMRKHSLPSSFKMWRKRMANRKTKHQALRGDGVNRFKCTRQKGTGNRISKR